MGTITIPVATGELADKITILDIKLERIDDAGKQANVRAELAQLLPPAYHRRHGTGRARRAAC